MTAAAPPVRTILVALDESPRAPLVIATASLMARGLAARLFPIRVLVIPPQIPPAAHTHPDGLEGFLAGEAREDLKTLMDAEAFVQFGTPIVVEGEPWREILVAARDLDVDLIIVGSHRYHGLDRILGTTAAKVVNHADRNVLVVHARPEVKNP